MPKGQKKSKGVPELHDEVKKRVNLSLTPTAIAGLDRLSQELNLSRSELVEQVGRGSLPLAEQSSLSEEFVISLTHSLSLTERDRLPEKMGAFLATDFAQFAYLGSSSNLKKRFAEQTFIEKLEKIKASKTPKSSDIQVIWIECNNYKVLTRIEQELLAQFRHLVFVQNQSSSQGKFL
ncbi:CopG/DNA-binding domain-containing protein [Stanieria sp. NIES-3757]|nr:CopG/DNA-binding domain-containing protein [Stanieria sp. NIES-3757]